MADKFAKKRKKRSYEQTSVKIPANVLLLDAVVRVVAQKGVEGTSTRAIATEAGHGLTDTVIYRFFSGKEDLMRQAFLRESRSYMKEMDSRFSVLWERNLPREQRMRFLWHSLWGWTTAHKTESTFLVRYYYSACFDDTAKRQYREIWMPLANRIQELVPGKETEQLFFMALETLETLASAAYPVCCGRSPDSASASEYGFRRVMGLVNEFIASESTVR